MIARGYGAFASHGATRTMLLFFDGSDQKEITGPVTEGLNTASTYKLLMVVEVLRKDALYSVGAICYNRINNITYRTGGIEYAKK